MGGAGNRRRFIPPPPDELEATLRALDQYLQAPDSSLHPLIRAFVVHYQFEAIHPFADGNGRVGRLLFSLAIHHWLKLDLPWLYLSEYFHATRSDYIAHLYRVSTQGDWPGWLEYCLRGTIKQAAASLQRLKALNKLRIKYRRDLKREKRLPDIVERLFAAPLVRTVEVQKAYNVTYETARADMVKQQERGILSEVEGSRPKAFIAPAICEIADGDGSSG